jgi:hypothetical protein
VARDDNLERKPDESEQIEFKALEKSADSEQDLAKKRKVFSVDSLNQQLLVNTL